MLCKTYLSGHFYCLQTVHQQEDGTNLLLAGLIRKKICLAMGSSTMSLLPQGCSQTEYSGQFCFGQPLLQTKNPSSTNDWKVSGKALKPSSRNMQSWFKRIFMSTLFSLYLRYPALKLTSEIQPSIFLCGDEKQQMLLYSMSSGALEGHKFWTTEN